MKIITKSDRYMLEHPKISIIWKFYQAHAKISKLTGATAPVKKVKEISSNGPLQTNQSGTKRSSKPHQVSTILVPPCCYVNDLGLALVPSNLMPQPPHWVDASMTSKFDIRRQIHIIIDIRRLVSNLTSEVIFWEQSHSYTTVWLFIGHYAFQVHFDGRILIPTLRI